MVMRMNPATGQYEDDGETYAPGTPSLRSLAMNSPLGVLPPGVSGTKLLSPPPPAPTVAQPQVDATSAPTGLAMVNQQLPTPDVQGLNAVKTQQDSSWTVRHNKASPEEKAAEAEVEKQIMAQGELAKRAAELQAKQAEDVARIEDEAALRKTEQAAQRSSVIDAGEKEYQSRQAKADAAYDQWSKTDIKALAPNAFSILGVALGGLAAGRGQNKAFAILQDKMNRDLDVQKSNLAKQLQVADRWGSRAEGARDLLKDQLKMLDVKQAATEDVVAARIRAQSARSKVPEIRLAGEQKAAEFAQSAAERRRKFSETERVDVQNTVQKRLIEANPAYSMGGAAHGIAPPGTVFGVGGVPIANVGDEKKAAKINDANNTYRVMNGMMGQLEEHYRKHGAVVPFTKQAQERESISSQLLTTGKELEKMGALSGPDMGLMEDAFGSTTEQITGRGLNKISKVRERTDQKHGAYLESNGLNAGEYLPKIRGDGHMPGQKSGAPDAGMMKRAQDAAKEDSPRGQRAREWLQQNGGQ